MRAKDDIPVHFPPGCYRIRGTQHPIHKFPNRNGTEYWDLETIYSIGAYIHDNYYGYGGANEQDILYFSYVDYWLAGEPIYVKRVEASDIPPDYFGGRAPRCTPDENPNAAPKRNPDPCGGAVPEHAGFTAGNPVRLDDLADIDTIPCLSLGGAGVPIQVGIHWNSRTWFDKIGTTSIGRGWTTSYLRTLHDTSYLGTCATAGCVPPIIPRRTLYTETGAKHDYTPLEGNPNTFSMLPGNYTRLIKNTSVTPNEYILTYRNGLKDIYNLAGQLIRVEDRFGNQALFTWAVNGTIGTLKIQNARTGQAILAEHEQATVPEFGTRWRLLRIKDDPAHVPTGQVPRQITLRYGTSGNETGRLITVTDAAGITRNFRYDAAGRVTTFYNGNNNPSAPPAGGAKYTQVTFDDELLAASGIVSRQVLANGTTIDFRRVVGQAWDLEVIYNLGKPDARTERYARGIGGRITAIYQPNSTTAYTAMAYDQAGNLTSVTDPLGRRVEYVYDSTTGDMTETRAYHDTSYTTYDATTLTYDSYGNMLSRKEPAGALTRWAYEGATGALKELGRWNGTTAYTTTVETNPVTINGAAVRTGLITGIKTPDGTWTQFTYDGGGYPASVIYDANYNGNTGRLALPTTTTFDWRGFLLNSTDLQGIQTRYEYTNRGWPSASVVDSVAGGKNLRTEYTYDPVGNLTKVVEDTGDTTHLNATTIYTYTLTGTDGGYAPTTIRNPLGQVTTLQYTAFGDLARITDPLQHATTYAYTPEGWVQRVTVSDGRITERYEYNAAGQTSVMTDTRGVRTEYTYDGKGRLATVKDGAAPVPYLQGSGTWTAINALTTYGYDPNDRLISLLDPQNRTVLRRTYDVLNRLASEQDGGNNTTVYTYDNQRDFVTQVAVGNNSTTERLITQYSYDRLGRVIRAVVDPGTGRKNLTTLYRYTTANSPDRWHLQEVVDPTAYALNPTAPPFKTVYRYNSYGLLAGVTDVAGNSWSYGYSNLGVLSSITPPTGSATSYGTDVLGRTTSLTRNGQTESWSYNADGTLATFRDFANQTTRYGYDAAQRLTGIDYAYAGGTPVYDATFGYSSNDLLTWATSKPDGVTSETTTYDYDAMNRMAKRTRSGRTVSYGYSPSSELWSMEYWGRGTTTYGYNNPQQLTSISPWRLGVSAYTYRSTGLLKTVQRPNSTTITSNLLTTYSYDTASRLTGIATTKAGVAVRNVSYPSLDANGNRLQLTDQTGTTTYTYDTLNRLTQAQYPAIAGGPAAATIPSGYDAVGNRTAQNGTTTTYDASDRFAAGQGYTYDLNGNLTKDPAGTTYTYDAANRLIKTVQGTTTAEYQYDALGNLIRTKVNGSVTDIVLDENTALPVILGEIRGTTEQLYAYGPDGLHAQRQVVNGTAQGVVYPLVDGLGSIRSLTSSNGTVIKDIIYDAWGNVRHQSGTAATGLGFTGEPQRTDGTVHLRARQYTPPSGRFLQRDTFAGFLDNPQSLNRYAYVEGNPVNWTDPSGYSTLEVHDYIPKDRDARATLEAAQRAARKNAQANRPPTVTTTVRDRTSGKTWSSGSGQRYPSRGVHPAIQGRLPNPSMRPWPCTNCGEPNALSRALHKGANPEDLDMASVETRTGRPVNRCVNCQVLTPKGVRVVTDHPTRGSIPPTFRKVKGARALKRAAQALPGVGLGIGIATDPANATDCGFRVTPGSVGNGLLGEIPIIGEIFAPERAAPATVDDARRMGLIP